ncbi:hypothetical protein LIA77_07140 [Sarocladium implicatum]|nr:hypothetical protein LIA77_07140 [Sarocladium implicatum]
MSNTNPMGSNAVDGDEDPHVWNMLLAVASQTDGDWGFPLARAAHDWLEDNGPYMTPGQKRSFVINYREVRTFNKSKLQVSNHKLGKKGKAGTPSEPEEVAYLCFLFGSEAVKRHAHLRQGWYSNPNIKWPEQVPKVANFIEERNKTIAAQKTGSINSRHEETGNDPRAGNNNNGGNGGERSEGTATSNDQAQSSYTEHSVDLQDVNEQRPRVETEEPISTGTYADPFNVERLTVWSTPGQRGSRQQPIALDDEDEEVGREDHD